MSHLDPETLAALALSFDDPDYADQAQHLAECDLCRAEVDELRHVAELSRLSQGDDRLDAPPPRVWSRITDQISEGADIESPPEPPAPTAVIARPRRRLLVAAAAAAVVGLIVGVFGTTLVTSSDDEQRPVATATARLEPLPGKQGSGTAKVVEASGGLQLRVATTELTPPTGYYEVWLINADGERMVSLGFLDTDGDGTFDVPADLLGRGYRTVDISLEPNDGDPQHSGDSIIRGTVLA